MGKLTEYALTIDEKFSDYALPLMKPAGGNVEKQRVHVQLHQEVVGCTDELHEQTFAACMQRLGKILSCGDSERMEQIMKTLVVGAMSVDVASALTVDAKGLAVEAAAHGLDAMDALLSLGTSILISCGLAWIFSLINGEKRAELARLTAVICLNAQLGRALSICDIEQAALLIKQSDGGY